jgi:hypothetical protein
VLLPRQQAKLLRGTKDKEHTMSQTPNTAIAVIGIARAPILLAELDPLDVLADLLGSGDFPAEVLDPDGAAKLIVERLDDAGFAILPNPREDRSHD